MTPETDPTRCPTCRGIHHSGRCPLIKPEDFDRLMEFAEQQPRKRSFEVTEGVSSVWHYHISENGVFTRGLCGAHTMKTSMTLKQWGHRSEHIGESYCKKCEELAGIKCEQLEKGRP